MSKAIVAGVAALAVGGLYFLIPGPKARPASHVVLPKQEKPLVTKAEIQTFLQKSAKSPDPEVQDRVGRARIQLAYLDVRKKNFAAARATLKTAAKEYKGKGIMSADFGGIPDQAKYQAICCLVAEGKKEEARKEFLQFLRDEPLSPLVNATYQRLVRLNDGQDDAEARKLLESALAQQQRHIRLETSSCGPKAIAYMLPLLGKPERDYRDIAKLCGTGEQGTTLDGMRKGLAALGVEVCGLQVNRRDVVGLKTPFLLLKEDHYLVAVGVNDKTIQLFDPRDRTLRTTPLPPSDDAKFLATVLATQVPTLNADLP